MAACCHDIGMSVSREQEKKLCTNIQTKMWKEYFKLNLKDDEEFSQTKKVSPRMLRSFVRINHHKRIGEQIKATGWPIELMNQGITRKVLVNLCQSHGESLEFLEVSNGVNFDLRLCAVLLRLADILDFDASRAPSDLFSHLGLDNPENFEEFISRTEWAKNRVSVFGKIKDGILPFTASFTNLQLECEVQYYLDWVQQELDSSSEFLSRFASKWQTLVLPRRISTDSVERNGYRFGKFCLTMDQDRILELLTGRNLYSDPGVFVRELLQNSIDAVLTRSKLDPYFNEEDGKIIIQSWMDDEGYSWFRIEDNGTGMNENIITNYFLKVGRSYYTSDDFKADKRHYGRGGDYTPISRFGIGVLSCFMSNPEQNMLEVSTKRYSQDYMTDNPAIRLNVTGLHGYYYLAQEGEQDESDEFFQSIHNPLNESEGYRTDVGTTICVRVNLYQLGGYRSFKEIVDKYVQFPRISVEYIGPEGQISYPTHRELMDTIHDLNPDGADKEPKEYYHPITDEQFEKLKTDMPDTTWLKRPEMVLQYYPLDWIAVNENVSGASIYGKIKADVIPPQFQFKGEEIIPELEYKLETNNSKCELVFYYSFEEVIDREMRLLESRVNDRTRSEYERVILDDYPIYGKDDGWLEYIAERYKVQKNQIQTNYEEMQNLRNDIATLDYYHRLTRSSRITFPYNRLLKQCSKEEKKVFQHVTQALRGIGKQFSDERNVMLTSYNGILADTNDLFGRGEADIGTVILLQDEYCPEVNVARNMISNVPLELACTLSIVQHVLPKKYYWYRGSGLLDGERFTMATGTELRMALDKHPEWEKHIRVDDKSLTEIKEFLQTPAGVIHIDIHCRSPYDYLRLTFMKRNFSVYCDNAKYWNRLCITDGITEMEDEEFPPALFFTFLKKSSKLGHVSQYSHNYYNREHYFSKWLVEQREALQHEVPGVYHDLLRIMILGENKQEIIEHVNTMLMRLKKYKRNMFKVLDTLFLKEGDLE